MVDFDLKIVDLDLEIVGLEREMDTCTSVSYKVNSRKSIYTSMPQTLTSISVVKTMSSACNRRCPGVETKNDSI